MIMRTVAIVALIASAGFSPLTHADPDTDAKPKVDQHGDPFAVDSQGPIENLLCLAPGLLSGSEPKGSDEYEQLAALGVKTVISVDAIAPSPELARKHDIRIIHLPIGYDGIDDERAKGLAFALQSAERPIYVHCHHGKHRGPAAISLGAIATGDIDHKQAKAFMTRAGTSSHYPGLWESVAQSVKLETLEHVRLQSKVRTRGMKETMANIDRAYESLWDCADNEFVAPEEHPDLAPASLAAQIHNLLRGLDSPRLTNRKGVIFHEDLLDSIDAASALEQSLKNETDKDAWMENLELLDMTCVECHSDHRN
jgi:protein tyrosine phosphatase (PTP) superfamily phosphohydrolase (DUF442 family)